jgi:exosortase
MSVTNRSKTLEQTWVENLWWLPLLLVFAGFAPLFYCHIVGLLTRPHYQFILLLPIAWWMLATTVPRVEWGPVALTDRVIAVVGLGASAIGLSYATWMWSPWIAAVGLMLAALMLMLGLLGRQGISSLMPVWIFSCILIPLPFGLDEDLIVRLRTITTRLTSGLLDQLGILHQFYANVIELPGKPLFIADACSGIHSLYVLMALALFLCVFCRRTVLHTIALLSSTFGLVLVENVARIAIVAIAWRRGSDFSMGWQHATLGVLLFAASAILIISMDQLLLFMLPESPMGLVKKLLLRNYTSGRFSPTSKAAGANRQGHVALLIVSLLFPAIGVIQLLRMPPGIPQLSAVFQSDLQLPDLKREAMPEQLGEFRLTEYETIARVEGDPFGRSSQRWMYQKGDITVGVSLDYPYEGVKDMTQCYEAVGWKEKSEQILDVEALSTQHGLSEAGASLAIVELERDLLGSSLLIFSSFDLTGKTSCLLKSENAGEVGTRFGKRVAAAEEQVANGDASNPPYLQLHVLVRSAQPLDSAERDSILKLYVESRRIMVPKVLTALGVMTGADAAVEAKQ